MARLECDQLFNWYALFYMIHRKTEKTWYEIVNVRQENSDSVPSSRTPVDRQDKPCHSSDF